MPPQRAPARHPCETREPVCHGQSPLSAGPCITLALSQAATPSLRTHYRASPLLRMAPTSEHHHPRPRFLQLFAGARLRRTDARISSVTAYSLMSGSNGLGPRGVPASLAMARYELLFAAGTNPSALSNHSFRGSTPSRSDSPVTLRPRLLSCLRIRTPVTGRPARLDTGLAASNYPGGIPTH